MKSGIRIDGTSTSDDPGKKCTSRAAANRYDPLLRALAHDTTVTFDQIDVADRQSNEFPKSQSGVEQHQKNRPVADGVARAAYAL